MQKVNSNNVIGLRCDLDGSLVKCFAKLSAAWAKDAGLGNLEFNQIRINPLVAEQHPTVVRKITVVQTSDVPVGKVELVAAMPF